MSNRSGTAVQRGTIRTGRSKPYRLAGRSLGLFATTPAKLIHAVERGLPYAAIVRFHKESGLPIGTLAKLIRLPHRTLLRRKLAGNLRPDESERLLRISGVFEQAVILFEGDAEAARKWLTSPAPELGNQAPLDLARTEIGARQVEDLIGRIEDGVFT